MAAKCSLAQLLCRPRIGGFSSASKVLILLLVLVLALLLFGGDGRHEQPEDESSIVGRGTARAAAAASGKALDVVRQVGCWRLGGAATDKKDDYKVQCSPVASDGTLVRPVAALAPAAASAEILGDGVNAAGAPSSSATRQPDYTYVACFLGSRAAGGTVLAPIHRESVTVASCVRACSVSGHAYAFLVGSNKCRCANQPSETRMLPDRRCRMPCTGDPSTLCGGRRAAAAVYHLRSTDGSDEWTAWMTPWGEGGSSDGSAAVRIRNCAALRSGSDMRTADADDSVSSRVPRHCTADLERRTGSGSLPQPPLFRNFVGCYAVATDLLSSDAVLTNETGVTAGCLRACEVRGFAYAFARLVSGCACAKTLGVSRPVAFCDGVYGLPFYVVRSPPDEDSNEDGSPRVIVDDDADDEEDFEDEDYAEEHAEGDRDDSRDYESDNDNKYEDTDDKGDSADDDAGDYKDDEDGEQEEDKAYETEQEQEEQDNETQERSEKEGGSRMTGRATVELLFDRPPPDKRHVLLLAYHRSGSTFASELVSKHPGALYTFEPDSIYSDLHFALGVYDDIEQLHREFYRSFDRYLRCDVHRLPPIWMTLSSIWPRKFEHSPRMAAYIGCVRAHGPASCAPYFQAQCEAASIVSAKTIRITATPQTAAFVREHPSLVVLHLMRDPRAVVSSRKYFHDVEDAEVKDLCECMERTRIYVDESQLSSAAERVAESNSRNGKLLFNVFYENLVLQPLQSAREIYSTMFRLNISAATLQRLRIVSGDAWGKKLDFKLNPAFTTRKDNPELSLRKWLKLLTPSEVSTIEELCASVLRWYPQVQLLKSSNGKAGDLQRVPDGSPDKTDVVENSR